MRCSGWSMLGVFLLSAPASAVTVTFEASGAPVGGTFSFVTHGPSPTPPPPGGAYFESGFAVSVGNSNGGAIYDAAVPGMNNIGNATDRVYLDRANVLIVERANGGDFSISSLDAAQFNPGAGSGITVPTILAAGYRDGALVGSAAFSQDFSSWQTLSFTGTGLDGASLDYLVLSGGPSSPSLGPSAFDNLNVEPVPEPGTMLLSCLGLTAGAVMSRRGRVGRLSPPR